MQIFSLTFGYLKNKIAKTTYLVVEKFNLERFTILERTWIYSWPGFTHDLDLLM